jgi:hypothetical protein
MLVIVILNQNVFTVTYVFFTVTNFPFRHELVLKRFVCHNFEVEIQYVHTYIFLLYSLTIAQWSKITELGYRCATTVSFKVTYVV